MAAAGASTGPLDTEEDIAFHTKEFIDRAKIDQLYDVIFENDYSIVFILNMSVF